MADHVEIRKDLPAGTVIINRPASRNALTPRGVQELQTAFADLHGEKKVRGVILTGAGDSFCAGTDLVHLHEQMQCPDPESFWQEEVPDLLALIETILRFPKPVVAAVAGAVRGTGLSLMLACDYIVSAEASTFGLPEVQRGLVPGFAAPLVARRCRAGFSNRLIMTGTPVDAATALSESLVDELVAADLVWARARQMVEELAAAAPTSLQLARQLMNETISETLFTQLSIGAANTAAARSTENARQGVAAFVDKTTLSWQH
jgi:methylglutaconyl-CoA hydratase